MQVTATSWKSNKKEIVLRLVGSQEATVKFNPMEVFFQPTGRVKEQFGPRGFPRSSKLHLRLKIGKIEHLEKI